MKLSLCYRRVSRDEVWGSRSGEAAILVALVEITSLGSNVEPGALSQHAL